MPIYHSFIRNNLAILDQFSSQTIVLFETEPCNVFHSLFRLLGYFSEFLVPLEYLLSSGGPDPAWAGSVNCNSALSFVVLYVFSNIFVPYTCETHLSNFAYLIAPKWPLLSFTQVEIWVFNIS